MASVEEEQEDQDVGVHQFCNFCCKTLLQFWVLSVREEILAFCSLSCSLCSFGFVSERRNPGILESLLQSLQFWVLSVRDESLAFCNLYCNCCSFGLCPLEKLAFWIAFCNHLVLAAQCFYILEKCRDGMSICTMFPGCRLIDFLHLSYKPFPFPVCLTCVIWHGIQMKLTLHIMMRSGVFLSMMISMSTLGTCLPSNAFLCIFFSSSSPSS